MAAASHELKWRDMDTNGLLQHYVSVAIAHSNATRTANYHAANSQYDTLQTIYRELRSRGASVQRTLLALLDHPNNGVRGWAAFHALEFASKEAEPVLEDLSKMSGIEGFTWEVTLEEWRKGTLKFP